LEPFELQLLQEYHHNRCFDYSRGCGWNDRQFVHFFGQHCRHWHSWRRWEHSVEKVQSCELRFRECLSIVLDCEFNSVRFWIGYGIVADQQSPLSDLLSVAFADREFEPRLHRFTQL
jgi:hypothetical protein